MLKKLENYYRHIGILSTEFSCEHLRECRGDSQNFTEAKSAFIGEKYGELNFPRLLFISSDPGGAKIPTKDGGEIDFMLPENRTPESVRRLVIERVRRGIKSPSQRAKSTNELARFILREFNSDVDEMDEEKLTQHFAHANSVKCCQNKKNHKQADGVLFRNCRGYLRGEIEMLAPDILITHGKKAESGVQFAFRNESQKEIAQNAFEYEMQNGKFFWLQTPHPASYGRPKFLAQKNGKDGGPGWAGYVKLIREFMKRKRD